MLKRTDYKKFEKEIKTEKKSCWEIWDNKTRKLAFDFSEGYKVFLNRAKTARETVEHGIKLAEKSGFRNIAELKNAKPGGKLYSAHRGKSAIFARIGKQGLKDGFKMLMAHVDSPHLDLKVRPLYEDESVAFLKTHYYGGIKKYQWPTIALALHGEVYLENGKKASFVIGEKQDDPVFMITDLLPHLDRPGGPGTQPRQREVQGEELNLVAGTIPVLSKQIKEKVKLAVLEHLYDNYRIKEEDLVSAEIEAVPSEKARDLGFDRSLISAYGHDDKSCAYASLQAFFDSRAGDQTQLCAWIDREEVGSDGIGGAQSIFIEVFISDLLKLTSSRASIDEVYRIFSASQAISADVVAAIDPDYKDVHDPRNAARLGYGVVLEKHTGSGGKYNSSEASAEYVQKLRMLFKKDKNLVYQIIGGMGKIDTGGGGTIAKYMANRNIEIIDMGVPLYNMHAPLEIASKADIYSAYLAYKLFIQA